MGQEYFKVTLLLIRYSIVSRLASSADHNLYTSYSEECLSKAKEFRNDLYITITKVYLSACDLIDG